MIRECSTFGEKKNAYCILVGWSEGGPHWEVKDAGGRVILG